MRAIVLALAIFFSAGALNAAEPVPFEALYNVTAKNWKMPGEIESYSGSQIVRLEKTCTDWRLVSQFRLSAASAEGGEIDFNNDLSGTESLDGTRYSFRSDSRLGGRQIMHLAGQATRTAAGQPGRIQFSAPQTRTTSLPPDALFPIAAFVWTARQWESGQKTANYVQFDGTTPEPVRVFELLTGSPGKPTPMPDGDTKLLESKAWRTTGSFHAYAGNDSRPLTTITQTVLSNAIATELSVDIGIADVTLQLRRIRALPEPKC